MPNIYESVGTHGRNAVHDVAMVQFMLKVLKSSQSAPFFGGVYSKQFSGATVEAIIAFQEVAGTSSPAGAKPGTDAPGLIKPGGPTWNALVSGFSRVDVQYKAARVTPGVNLVYVPMTVSQRTASLSGIADAKKLVAVFRKKVNDLVEAVYKKSEIVWSLVPTTGAWRSFSGQEGLVSDAGNGETIHNYGYAVDLTVGQFSWFGDDLRPRISPISLHGLDELRATQLFTERDKVATTLGLFNTAKGGDQYHLQNFDDDTLDSVGSLMALMHAYGPRKMKWKSQFKKPTNYLCDLGLGGDYYYAGTAADIWNQHDRHISGVDLAAALNAKKKSDPKFSIAAFLGRPAPTPAADGKTAELKPSDLTPADFKTVRAMLKAEFQAAADNWQAWKRVKYPNADRRKPNPVKH